MSDTTATVEAPVVAPAATPAAAPQAPAAPEATPTPTPTPERPATAREARQRVIERARANVTRQTTPEVAPTTETAPRDDKGRFSTESGTAPVNSPEGTPSVEAGQATPSGPPEGFVRIPVPNGHPLQARGVMHLDFPAAQEEYGRWSVNQAVKNSEIAEARQNERQARRQIEAVRAEAEFWRSSGQEFFGEDFKQTYEDLKATYGEDYAEEFKQGRLAKAQSKLEEMRGEKMRELETQEIYQSADRFKQLATGDARQKFPHWSPQDVEKALQHYGAWVATNNVTELKASDWYNVARALYLQHPRVRQEMVTVSEQRRREEHERIRREVEAEAATKEKERLTQAAASRRANPMGRIPNVQTGVSPEGAGQERPSTAREARDAARRRARGLA